jgi:hypothetical protein
MGVLHEVRSSVIYPHRGNISSLFRLKCSDLLLCGAPDSGVLSPFFFYLPLGKRLTTGPTDVYSFYLRPLLFRDFDLIAADKREDRCFDTKIHDVLPHRKNIRN